MVVDERTIFELMRKRNVVGVSKRRKPKIVNGKETEELSIRVYVSEKLPIESLHPKDVIPPEINGIKTDVVKKGELKALYVDPTKKFRPVKFGVSIGNFAITAGTNGWLFEKDGNLYFGSNAHVFTPDASMMVDEVLNSETRIVQPGKYDGGTPSDVVARYAWHEQVKPYISQSGCPIGRAITKTFNWVSEKLGRKTRLYAYTMEKNHIDFAVATPLEGYETEIINMDKQPDKFVGLLFAGSDEVTVVCKGKYIEEKGFTPFNAKTVEVSEGDMLCKSGRTTRYTYFKVEDDSAMVQVNYINFIAVFDDVLICGPNGSKGGDSGSSVWVKAPP